MSYPINDIFEGTADLLLEHGILLQSYDTPELNVVDTYISYGGYTYILQYVAGELRDIYRFGKKESDNG